MKSSVSLLLLAFCVQAQTTVDNIRMNQARVLGSHNSYKQAIEPALYRRLIQEIGPRMQGLEYHHIAIQDQLDRGLRSLEIDVVYDPAGGLYAHPKGLDLAPPVEPYDPQSFMRQPGFKVLHVPDIDFRANVYTFTQELALLRAWSTAHPRHLPVVITMNAKDDGIHRPGFVQPLAFDAAAFAAWDAEIISGLSRSKLILPSDVQGRHATLRDAVLAHDWPPLDQVRGKFLFVLDETGKKLQTYLDGHPSLQGRVMFVNSADDRPEAAVRIVNDPKAEWPYIQSLVRSGYLVRTRADADTAEARNNDTSRWKAALISGAQIISTDYYLPNPDFPGGYHVAFPDDSPGLWNPLLLPALRPLPPVE